MSEHRPPAPTIIEVLLFAPVGAVVALRENLPKWAEQGKARAETRVRVARMVGEFAVRTGVKEVERRIAGRIPARPGTGNPAETGSNTAESAAPSSSQTGSTQGDAGQAPVNGSAPSSREGDAVQSTVASVPHVDALPIPAYDSLAASQVVERLDGLSAEELASVRAYEAAGRHRQTVLHRIDQLSGS